MSMQKKTLAVLVALSVGASFGAAANGWGGGGTEYNDDGSHNTNYDGNQANDKSVVVDVDKTYVKKTKIDVDVNKTDIDLDYKFISVKKTTAINKQSNFTIQKGYTGDTKSKSDVHAGSVAVSGNYADADQRSANLGTGLGLGLGLGVGVGLGHGEGGDGGNALGLGLLGLGFGFNDADGVGLGAGTGLGAGVGAGAGLAKQMSDQDLDQKTRADAATNVWSVSMIRSGNNTVGNTGATHGINTQQAISGQSAMGQQSVNVNASVQF
ncbi:hypothetical protein [Oceanisphaera sp. KMM 10153]|uniref:hypothetical protein n=1 Tax=Oceanisphaera submarina TaxID=3390193 RepID=UPI0039750453